MANGIPNKKPVVPAKEGRDLSDSTKELSMMDKMKKLVSRKSKDFKKFIKEGEDLRIAVVQSKDDKKIEITEANSTLEVIENDKEWRIRGPFITNKVNLNNTLYTKKAIKDRIADLNENNEILPIYKDHTPKNGVFGAWDKFEYEENGEDSVGYAEGTLFKKKYAVKDLWTDINELGLNTGISWGGYSINPKQQEINGADIRVADELEVKEISITDEPADTKCELEVKNELKDSITNNKGPTIINKVKTMDKKDDKIIETNEEAKEEAPAEEVEKKEEVNEEAPKEEVKKEEEAPKEEEKKKEENSVTLKVEELNQLKEDSKELGKIKEQQAFDATKKEVLDAYKVSEDKIEAVVNMFSRLSTEEKALISELNSKEEKADNLDILKTGMVKETSSKDVSNDNIVEEAQARAKKNGTLAVDEVVSIYNEKEDKK